MARKEVRIVLWIATIAVAGMIFGFSCQDGDTSMQTSSLIVDPIVQTMTSHMPPMNADQAEGMRMAIQFLVRKLAHFTEFALLGFLISCLTHSYACRHAGSLAWLSGAAYAASDELHQFLGGSRTGMWQDVVLDSVGVLAGACVASLLCRKLGERRHNHQENQT